MVAADVHDYRNRLSLGIPPERIGLLLVTQFALPLGAWLMKRATFPAKEASASNVSLSAYT